MTKMEGDLIVLVSGIILELELEIRGWSDSLELDRCGGWRNERPNLRTWLRKQGLWPEEDLKPTDAKKAAEWSLRRVRRPRSSSFYKQVAREFLCADAQILLSDGFLSALRDWFPLE